MTGGPLPTRRSRGELLSSWLVSRVFYNFLLVFLASLFVLSPIANRTVAGITISRIIGAAVILAGVLAVSQHHVRVIIAGVLGGASLVVMILLPDQPAAQGTSLLLPIHYALFAALLLFVCGCVFWELFHESAVSVGSLSGALCIYLLLGVAFGSIFEWIDWHNPTAFSGLDAADAGGDAYHRETSSLIYYSFVTLTTLGYGDITPKLPIARNLAMIEAILGQVVLVVLVARLVGMHAAVASRRD